MYSSKHIGQGRRRRTKSSHFVEEVEIRQITPNNSNIEASRRKQENIFVPTVRPGQPPIERVLDTDVIIGSRTEENPVKLSLQSMQRIHKLIEAQKNFLRYYEMREKLDEKRSRESARAKSQSESQPQSFEPYTFHSSSSTSRDTRGQTEEKTKDTISSDSDKENSSRAINSSRPSRKVAKLSDNSEAGLKRRSGGEPSEMPPEKCSKVDVVVSTEPPPRVDEETQTSRQDGVRVVLSSRKRFVARLGEEHANAGQKEEQKQDDKQKPDDKSSKPWRINMKSKPSVAQETEETPVELSKPPEKPWRSNMKAKVNVVAPPPEAQPKEKTEPSRPWRANMKAQPQNHSQPEPIRKKRHYDRDSVRKFMIEKKKREKQEKEENEKKELLRQELIRQRLDELEKLQKQIVETDFSTEKKTSNEGEEGSVPGWQEAPTRTGQVDLAIRGQELIRQKLLELTNQMKEKWKIKQIPLSETLGAAGVGNTENSDWINKTGDETSIKKNIEFHNAEADNWSKNEGSPRLDGSDTSDATEIRSLPESRTISRSVSRDKEVFSREDKVILSRETTDKEVPSVSQQDKELISKENNLELSRKEVLSGNSKGENISISRTIQTLDVAVRRHSPRASSKSLTDEIPERDLSDNGPRSAGTRDSVVQNHSDNIAVSQSNSIKVVQSSDVRVNKSNTVRFNQSENIQIRQSNDSFRISAVVSQTSRENLESTGNSDAFLPLHNTTAISDSTVIRTLSRESKPRHKASLKNSSDLKHESSVRSGSRSTYAEEFSRLDSTLGDQIREKARRSREVVNEEQVKRDRDVVDGEPAKRNLNAIVAGEKENMDAEFSPKFPGIICRGPKIKEVDPTNDEKLSDLVNYGSQETIGSDKPPHWIEVTMDSSGTEFGNIAPQKFPPPKHPRQKLSLKPATLDDRAGAVSQPSDKTMEVMNISEGPLSPESSGPSEFAGRDQNSSGSSISGIPARLQNKHSAVVNNKADLRGMETDSSALEDSASTMKDVHDTLNLIPSASRKDKVGRRTSRRPRADSRNRTSGVTSRSVMVSTEPEPIPPNSIPIVPVRPDSISNTMHLRFMTELNQLESVNATEQLLAELEQIKRNAFESQQSLAEVQKDAEDRRAREQREMQERNSLSHVEKINFAVNSARDTLQELYASKLKELLESQTEATKATTAVAKQLGELHMQAPSRDSNLVETLNKLQSTMENLNRRSQTSASRTTLSGPSASRSTSSGTLSDKTTITEKQTSKPSRSTPTLQSSRTGQEPPPVESRGPSLDPDRGEDFPDSATISSAVILETAAHSLATSSSVKEIIMESTAHSLATSSSVKEIIMESAASSSSVKEMLDLQQAQGESIAQTISEALASISEAEQKTRSNITAEVEDELSTDYSSNFDEESTLREQSFRALFPSETHRRKSEKFARTMHYSSDASESSITGSEKGRARDPEDTSSGSLFSDSDSFTRFTLEMVHQYMAEEKSRDRHKETILKLKEQAIIEKAKKQVKALELMKTKMTEKGKDEKMPKIKRKQKSILNKLQEQQSEIARMRDNLRVAEKERRFLIKQQKSILKQNKPRHTNLNKDESGNLDSKPTANTSELGVEDAKVAKSLSKMEKKARHLTSKEKRLNDKTQTEEVNKTPEPIVLDEDSNVSEHLPSGSKSSILLSRDIFQPISAATLHRLRHSSAESDADNLSVSLNDTVSDQSDIEARVAALNEQLQNRIKTAARLKKEQRRDKREKLKNKEQTLLKQIEIYDKLISEGKSDKVDQQEKFTKPIIKSPKSSISEKLTAASSRELNESTTENKLEASIDLEKSETLDSDGSRVESQNSNILSEAPSYSHDTEDISRDSDSSQKSGSNNISTSTVLASPNKAEVSPSLFVRQENETVSSISEASDFIPVTESTSEIKPEHFVITEPINDASTKFSKPNIGVEPFVNTSRKISTEKSDSPSDDRLVLDLSEKNEKSSTESLTLKEPLSDQPEEQDDEEKKAEDFHQNLAQTFKINGPAEIRSNVERLTDTLWAELLKDTNLQVSPLVKSKPKNTEKPPESIPAVSSPVSSPVKNRMLGPTSPRSKPQDLMLTTFDISPESSDNSPVETQPDLGEDKFEAESQGLDDDQFFDDDFGLSAIREEAESLRLQQLKVEEEIARLQSQEAEQKAIAVRQIPNKPPPPYIPPARPPKPQLPKQFIPHSTDHLSAIIDLSLASIYSARLRGEDISKVEVDLGGLDKPEELAEVEVAALEQYHEMLVDLVREKVERIYRDEGVEQNPPWMPAKPVKKLKFLVPKSLETLSERVKKQMHSDFGLVGRVERESLLVRWAGKKRDRVDEILVRELQEEEEVWTDFAVDEVEVKDQLVDTLVLELIQDTATTFNDVFKRKQKNKK